MKKTNPPFPPPFHRYKISADFKLTEEHGSNMAPAEAVARGRLKWGVTPKF